MEFTYGVTYHACQSCAGKTPCAQCAGELEEKLLRQPGIAWARLDLNARQARVSGTDEDSVIDALEAAGLFID